MEKARGKMKDFELEMRGRLTTIEAMQATMLAHIAELTQNPPQFLAQIMDNVEHNLGEGERNAPDAEQRTAARYAIESYRSFSAAMLAHINRHAAPSGRG